MASRSPWTATGLTCLPLIPWGSEWGPRSSVNGTGNGCWCGGRPTLILIAHLPGARSASGMRPVNRALLNESSCSTASLSVRRATRFRGASRCMSSRPSTTRHSSCHESCHPLSTRPTECLRCPTSRRSRSEGVTKEATVQWSSECQWRKVARDARPLAEVAHLGLADVSTCQSHEYVPDPVAQTGSVGQGERVELGRERVGSRAPGSDHVVGVGFVAVAQHQVDGVLNVVGHSSPRDVTVELEVCACPGVTREVLVQPHLVGDVVHVVGYGEVGVAEVGQLGVGPSLADGDLPRSLLKGVEARGGDKRLDPAAAGEVVEEPLQRGEPFGNRGSQVLLDQGCDAVEQVLLFGRCALRERQQHATQLELEVEQSSTLVRIVDLAGQQGAHLFGQVQPVGELARQGDVVAVPTLDDPVVIVVGHQADL